MVLFLQEIIIVAWKKAFPNGRASNSGYDEAAVEVKECHFRISRQQT
jgi:hypothetical protein